MLSFCERFPRKGIRNAKGIRSRVVGEFEGKKLLYSINNSKQTSIEVISSDGDSITAISFHEYMDIVNASLSPDNEFCHFTKRITSKNGFAFCSIFYHIHTNTKSKEFISNYPIKAFFCSSSNPQFYSVLHIIGSKINHLKVSFVKESVNCEIFRGGITIGNVISYNYFRQNDTLFVLNEQKQQNYFTEYNLKTLKTISSFPVNINNLSKLPSELALNPLSPAHLPYFRIKNNRIFCTKYGSKVCIIQQLFENVESCLQFNICMYPGQFNTIISVPNASSDLPLCIQQFNSLIFAFVVNSFICIIDIAQNPPFISLQTHPLFCTGVCSDCAAPLPIRNHIIDLNDGNVYEVNISLSN